MDNHHKNLSTASRYLAQARDQLTEEIQNYPTPISGCDAQYNYLLAERTKVQNALRELDTEVFVPTPRIPAQGDRVESR